ncbi:MAG: hypothetical protein H6832_13095 [Planctomycetes bacterium]|nr:hypothetical protein [Planctomycetota bacterium]
MASAATAQSPKLLTDLNERFYGDSNPSEFKQLGTDWYFAANGGLWKWNSQSGVQLVFSNAFAPLGVVGGRVLCGRRFATATEYEIWSTDGRSHGKIADAILRRWPDGADGAARCTFVASPASKPFSYEFWVSDGTAANTASLSTASLHSQDLVHVEWRHATGTHSATYFLAPSTSGNQLFRSDGRPSNLEQVSAAPFPLSSAGSLEVATTTAQLTIWCARDFASAKGLVRVQLSSPQATATVTSFGEFPRLFPNAADVRGTTLYFGGYSAATGNEVWRARVDAAPELVADLEAGAGSSAPRDFLADIASPVVYFSAQASGRGRELYAIDASDQVKIVADIAAGAASSSPLPLAHVGSRLFFSAETAQHGRELWVTAGSSRSTQMVIDLAAGTASSRPSAIHVVPTRDLSADLLFSASGPKGREPYRFRDANGLELLADLAEDRTEGSRVDRIVEAPNGEAWLRAYPQYPTSTVHQWYRSRGTATTTVVVGGPQPMEPPVFTDDWRAWFPAQGSGTGVELHVSDGTTTTLVSDLNPGASHSSPSDLTVCADKVFHVADDGVHGRELCLDGALYHDIRPGPESSHPRDLVRSGNWLFFTADDGVHGRELWALEWRGAATAKPLPRMHLDIRPGAASSDPRDLVTYRSRIFFSADDGVHGRELWRTSTTGSSVVLIKDVNPGLSSGMIVGTLVSTDTRLYFAGVTAAEGVEPWFSNGETAGTNMIADLQVGSVSSHPRGFVETHHDRVAFSADDGVHGRELWYTNAVTTTLRDLVPGAVGSQPEDLFWDSGALWFSASDAAAGREPWIAEGIDLEKARLVVDLRPGTASSRPSTGYQFTVAWQQLVFAADDGVHGIEPFVVSPGGITRSVGQGCGGEMRVPKLKSTAAKLGSNLQLNGFGGPQTTSAAVVYASARPIVPLPLKSCQFQLDLATLIFITSKPVQGAWVAILPIPTEASLNGSVLRLGGLLYPSTDPFLGADIMNAVELRVGR